MNILSKKYVFFPMAHILYTRRIPFPADQKNLLLKLYKILSFSLLEF